MSILLKALRELVGYRLILMGIMVLPDDDEKISIAAVTGACALRKADRLRAEHDAAKAG